MATFYNQATLSYNGNTTTSNITTGELVEVLSATKTAVQTEYQQDDTLTYVVNILNSGNTTMTGVTISDNLGAYTLNTITLVPMDYVVGTVRYYVGGVLQPTPTVTAGPSSDHFRSVCSGKRQCHRHLPGQDQRLCSTGTGK